MNQHLHIITLGVRDFKKSYEVLYRDTGLETIQHQQG